MGLDLEKVRRAYFSGPPTDQFTHVPTLEELVAESERTFVRLCVENGGDPKAEGLGEHGALIGGPNKPPRILSGGTRRLEHYGPPRLAPVEWFMHDRLMPTDFPPAGQGHRHLGMAIAQATSGCPPEERPTPEQWLAALRADKPNKLEGYWLYAIFANADIPTLRMIMMEESLPHWLIVKALHNVGAVRHSLARWLNQFAEPPPSEA